jgi:hypothetical protein
MLHHDDVEYFLQRFEDLATTLGTILNKEKTRIMTTTTSESLIPRLKQDTTLKQWPLSLWRMPSPLILPKK